MTFPIHKIHVENSVRRSEVTRHVLDNAPPDAQVEFVDDPREVVEAYRMTPGALHRGKQSLLLASFRGEAIKPCPGTNNYLCCDYQILNYAQGCPMDCTYCALQAYFSNPLLTLQADSESFLAAAAKTLRAEPDRFFRLGTGEFADSLALDPLTGYAGRLVEFIRDFPNAVLELKSKAACVENLLDLDHRGRTICAWSVNAEEIVEQEEFRVATLDERLAAAARCEAAGYRLAFHFDPLIHFEGWEASYRLTIEKIFQAVRPQSIAWISLGCFRYAPGLESVIRERFPKSKYIFGEFIHGGDKKMRYPQPLRIHIYEKIVHWIRHAAGENIRLYFCMENASVWESVLGRAPIDNAELGKWLDESV